MYVLYECGIVWYSGSAACHSCWSSNSTPLSSLHNPFSMLATCVTSLIPSLGHYIKESANIHLFIVSGLTSNDISLVHYGQFCLGAHKTGLLIY